jgi:hypothetical protein
VSGTYKEAHATTAAAASGKSADGPGGAQPIASRARDEVALAQLLGLQFIIQAAGSAKQGDEAEAHPPGQQDPAAIARSAMLSEAYEDWLGRSLAFAASRAAIARDTTSNMQARRH